MALLRQKNEYICFTSFYISVLLLLFSTASVQAQPKKALFMPSKQELYRPFGNYDKLLFQAPSKVYYPETWFHFIGGNVAKDGITTDIEAIAKAGFSGIHLFHGQFGGAWPGVQPQIPCLSPSWDEAVNYAASECRRLGLKFLMNNTPGWATSGGPWITPSNAMRTLVWSRTDLQGGAQIAQVIAQPQPSNEPWRDYKDITLIAFPTPDGDTGKPLIPESVKSDGDADWMPHLAGNEKDAVKLQPATAAAPHWIEVTFAKNTLLRSVEFPSVESFSHAWCYQPDVKVIVQALLPDGRAEEVAKADMPASNFEDNKPITLACSEVKGVSKYRISIINQHSMAVRWLHFYTAARKSNWESEAAWTLRGSLHSGDTVRQSSAAFINPATIIDLSGMMDKDGKLNWRAPKGNWTVIRLGHVNSGKKNSPAPPEATGWEANKLDASGADAHFSGYIGRLSAQNGPLSGGLLDGMLIDSWECNTQTWTRDMENQFKRVSNYELAPWFPALLGYVVKDPATTSRFLTDWRRTINNLFSNNFYGRLASLTHSRGLNFTFETAAGDVFPGDILEYFKYADVPMCEFWQPLGENYVGSLNFKPVKPTVSAARIYGKPRVAAESFTSFNLTWDEHFEMLREVANVNAEEGVTHFVFHTYTHNPEKPFLPPGTSFGDKIGTPFLRGQTWWPYMPEFNRYLARCTYMLERGKPVSDVLWYLGDEIEHKPDQNAPFPEGFKYDYCNPDVLVNRLSVKNGLLVTPEGLEYRLLWLPNTRRMLPSTLQKLYALVLDGATIVGDAPQALATLSNETTEIQKFNSLVNKIWGNGKQSISKVGKGTVIAATPLGKALAILHMQPDMQGGDALWLHRKTPGADWYFISAPKGKDYSGEISFRQIGNAEIWDPVTGSITNVASRKVANRTIIKLDLAKSNACFVIFRKSPPVKLAKQAQKLSSSLAISKPWTIMFPAGWGITVPVKTQELKPWKDLDLSPEGKAFSGTAIYTTTFNISKKAVGDTYILDLGNVDMAASVSINGKKIGDLLAPPYHIDLKNAVRPGENMLEVKVTSTWFNRLVFDAGQPQEKRKTWVIAGPAANADLRASGLMGPVKVIKYTTN